MNIEPVTNERRTLLIGKIYNARWIPSEAETIKDHLNEYVEGYGKNEVLVNKVENILSAKNVFQSC